MPTQSAAPALPADAGPALAGMAARIRRIVLEQSRRANVGHIGSALCIAELLAAVYHPAHGALTAAAPEDPNRDRFILSKGHASLALYAALHLRGWLEGQTLETYCGDDTLLGVHPEHALRGVDFSTGSLGHGLSMGAGAVLAARLSSSERRAFVLVSDAELNEGAVWEAAMFAAHHQLGGLVALVDDNGQQALGHTRDVLNLGPVVDLWRAYGWDAVEVDGHDAAALRVAMGERSGGAVGRPRAVVARTTFGKGVSYMERQVKWHYWPMSDAEYAQALAEIEAAREAGTPAGTVNR